MNTCMTNIHNSAASRMYYTVLRALEFMNTAFRHAILLVL